MSAPPASGWRAWYARPGVEVPLVYLGTLIGIRLVVQLVQSAGLPDLLLALVPILFMYMPVWSCRLRGADPWDYPMALPSFRDRDAWLGAARVTLVLCVLVVVPYVLGYHLWQTVLVPAIQDALGVRLYAIQPALRWVWPSNPLKLAAYHLFFVAIPEEMFYRGYLQTRLDEVWAPRWDVLGTTVGPGLLVTCVLFAFGHSLVVLQWWHVFIIVPSLAFGWLRQRTGGIVAGAFFHAWCNVTVAVLDTLYGIVPP
ncbi:MAG: CPBP family intramembrane metalloprotease [Myxococcales bacterium]|nr:CPBP family intramembrane metalloprotease [Myxococcales bacterium]